MKKEEWKTSTALAGHERKACLMEVDAACALQNFNFDLDGLPFAFAALREPGGKAFGETLGSKAVTGFEAAFGDGQGIVKIGRVGEIAHGELVKPF